MASAKVENYSAEQIAKVVELYEAGKGMSVELIAEAVGKSAKSVIAKLAKEGVYVAKSSKTHKAYITKSEFVKRIETSLSLTGMESLEKATREALETLSKKVEQMEDMLAALDAAVDAAVDADLVDTQN